MKTNSFRAVVAAAIAAWLNTSQRSRVDTGMNWSALECSVNRLERSYELDTALRKVLFKAASIVRVSLLMFFVAATVTAASVNAATINTAAMVVMATVVATSRDAATVNIVVFVVDTVVELRYCHLPTIVNFASGDPGTYK